MLKGWQVLTVFYFSKTKHYMTCIFVILYINWKCRWQVLGDSIVAEFNRAGCLSLSSFLLKKKILLNKTSIISKKYAKWYSPLLFFWQIQITEVYISKYWTTIAVVSHFYQICRPWPLSPSHCVHSMINVNISGKKKGEDWQHASNLPSPILK